MLQVKFKNEELIPDIIDEAPKSLLHVNFNGSEIQLGNELTPTQVQSRPSLSWTPEENTFYTLIFTDPDAPSRANPIRREFLHWLIVNIPEGDYQKGDVLAEFLSSAPPKDSNLHRYTFLLFKQQGKLKYNEKKIPDTTREGRRHFSVRKFTEKYNLGQAIAGNYYLAQWDEYVEEINKKLTI